MLHPSGKVLPSLLQTRNTIVVVGGQAVTDEDTIAVILLHWRLDHLLTALSLVLTLSSVL